MRIGDKLSRCDRCNGGFVDDCLFDCITIFRYSLGIRVIHAIVLLKNPERPLGLFERPVEVARGIKYRPNVIDMNCHCRMFRAEDLFVDFQGPLGVNKRSVKVSLFLKYLPTVIDKD